MILGLPTGNKGFGWVVACPVERFPVVFAQQQAGSRAAAVLPAVCLCVEPHAFPGMFGSEGVDAAQKILVGIFVFHRDPALP